MNKTHPYHLSVAVVAEHFGLSARTVRDYLKSSKLAGTRIEGAWRLSWPDVWAAEQGPTPRGARQDHYTQPLLSKRQLAAQWGVSARTVERWITDGLPTRNVFGNVRIAPVDASDWTRRHFGPRQ